MCRVCRIDHTGKCLIQKINNSTPIFTEEEKKKILSKTSKISKVFIRKNRFNQNLPDFVRENEQFSKKIKESCTRAITNQTSNILYKNVADIVASYIHG